MNKFITISILLAILFAIDYYVYQGAMLASRNLAQPIRTVIRYSFWGLTFVTFAVILFYNFGDPYWLKGQTRSLIFTGIFINYFSKVFAALFLLSGDIVRLGQWIATFFKNPQPSGDGNSIPRSEFLAKTAMVAGTLPLVAMSWGIISGAHDYGIRRKTIYLPNLPSSFDGITIGQVSDIHSGSFFNKLLLRAVWS